MPARNNFEMQPRPTSGVTFTAWVAHFISAAGGAPFEGGDMINKIYKQRMEDPPPLESRRTACRRRSPRSCASS